jgi:hypothetical protein
LHNFIAVARVGQQVSTQTVVYRTTSSSVEDTQNSQAVVCPKAAPSIDTQDFQQGDFAPVSHSNPLSARYSRETHFQSFSLGLFNFRKRTIKHYWRKLNKDGNIWNQASAKSIWEDNAYAWASRLIGYGI